MTTPTPRRQNAPSWRYTPLLALLWAVPASCSLVAWYAVGKQAEEIKTLRAEVQAMRKLPWQITVNVPTIKPQLIFKERSGLPTFIQEDK